MPLSKMVPTSVQERFPHAVSVLCLLLGILTSGLQAQSATPAASGPEPSEHQQVAIEQAPFSGASERASDASGRASDASGQAPIAERVPRIPHEEPTDSRAPRPGTQEDDRAQARPIPAGSEPIRTGTLTPMAVQAASGNPGIDTTGLAQAAGPGIETAASHGVRIEEGTLAFAGGQFRPNPGLDPNLVNEAASTGHAHGYILVRGRLDAALFDRLHAHGIETFGVLPYQAIQARIPDHALASLQSMSEVIWVGQAPAVLKFHPNLLHRIEQSGNLDPIPVWISWMEDDASLGQPAPAKGYGLDFSVAGGPEVEGISHARLSQGPGQFKLQANGVRVDFYRERSQTFAAVATPAQLREIASWSQVHFLDDRSPDVGLHDNSVSLVGQDYVRALFDGFSAEVGIIDSGFQRNHMDLGGYVVGWDVTGQGVWLDNNGHGTHVAGTVMGDGTADLRLQGLAPGIGKQAWQRAFIGRYLKNNGEAFGDINLIYSVFGQPYTDPQNETTFPPKVVNCSWGTPPAGAPWVGTEQACIDVDQAVWQHRQNYVFAAGNSGSLGIARPAVAKNVLAVGGVRDFERQPGDRSLGDVLVTSGRGPTADNRIKPEIMAPGQWVESADTFDLGGYTKMGGTSPAAAHVTGMLASLIDHYPGQFNRNPKMQRAWMMATAIKKGGNRPVDNVYGFGYPVAERMHWSNAHWTATWLPDAFVREGVRWGLWSLTVPPGTKRLTIVTTWDEPPVSIPGGATPVMGHLDVYVDWFNDDPGGTGGDLVSNGEANYQYLVIDNPPPGTHSIKFWPRDSDLDDDGLLDDLWFSSAVVMDHSTVRPDIAMQTVVANKFLKPGETTQVTTTVTGTGHLANLVSVNIEDLPKDVELVETTVELKDGKTISYQPGATAVALGAITGDDARSVTWTFRGTKEGTLAMTTVANSDNGPKPEGSTVRDVDAIMVDGTEPGSASNLFSENQPVNGWSTNTDFAIEWDAATDDRSGLAGYNFLLANTPTQPATSIELHRETTRMDLSLGEGLWFFNLRSADFAGNWDSDTATYGPFGVDLTPPGIAKLLDSPSHPVGEWRNDSSVQYTWVEAPDNLAGIDGYSLLTDDQPTGLPPEVKTIDALTSYSEALGEGDWYFKIRARDRAGNWSQNYTSHGPIRIDLTQPETVGQLQSSTHVADEWSQERSASFDWTAAFDARSGIGGYSVEVSPTPSQPDDMREFGALTLDYNERLDDGIWYFNIRSLDKAGNWDDDFVSYGPVKVDKTPPGKVTALDAPGHPEDSWSNVDSVSFQWDQAPDATSGIDGYAIEVDEQSGGLPAPNKTIEELTSYTTTLPEGEWFLKIRAVDNAQNWSDNKGTYGPVGIDLTEPEAVTGLSSSSHTPNNWQRKRVAAMDWTAAVDSLSGLFGYSVEFAAAPTLPDETREIGFGKTTYDESLADGIWYFNIRSVDRAGNWDSDYESFGPLQIDVTDPELVTGLGSSTHTAGDWSNDPAVTWTWTKAQDNLSGLRGYSYRRRQNPSDPLEDERLGDVSSFADTLNEGTWYFNIRAVDEAGNWDDEFASFGPVQIDLTPPGRPRQLASSSHAVDTWTNDPAAQFNWAEAVDNLSGIDGYSVAIGTDDTTPPAESKTIEEVTSYGTQFSEGEWYFKLRSVDNATNWGPGFAVVGPFKIDLTEPGAASHLGSSSHQANIWSNDEQANFDWTAAIDNLSGLRGYSIDVSPTAALPDEVRDLPAVTDWSTTLGEGSWYVNLRSVDKAGNWDGDFLSLGPIQIDLTDPELVGGLTSSTHSVDVWTNLDTIDYQWTAAPDNLSGTKGYGITTQKTATKPEKTQDLGWVTTHSETLGEGTWYFTVRALDEAGNWDADYASFGPIRVDLTAPPRATQLKSNNQTVDVWSNDPNAAFSWVNPIDNLSGLDGYSVAVDTNSTTLPPETKTIEEVTNDSLVLGEGEWFYKLRSVDNAGNWGGGFRSVGPIKIDLTEPGAPTALNSATHQAGVWNKVDQVDFDWVAAIDNLSGVSGYSLELAPSPTLPDTTEDIGDRTTWSRVIAEGEWYLNLRSKDVAGNWDGDFSSFGPIRIDTTKPETVGGLSSSTHTAGEWSNLDSITYQWSAAPDNLSGIEGYSIRTKPTADLPDNTVDIGPLTTHTEPLPEGTWFFSIRSRDNAGNWDQDFASLGPIQIDLTVPGRPRQLSSGSHTADEWTNLAQADFSWLEANDNLSGIDGYGLSITPTATIPPESKTIEEVTAESVVLAEGEWHFNLRAVDNAGNWATNYESFGPLKIDLTEPELASSLSSSTHQAGVWSKDSQASFDWIAALDNLSGLRGYSLEVGPTASLPDATAEIGAIREDWDEDLTEGIWYLNLRSLDKAGNWDGDFASFGPIQIDTTEPEVVTGLASSSHTVDQWSNQENIQYQWTRAVDNLSGIGGYSLRTKPTPGLPDATVDIGDDELYSEVLPEGEWHFSLRSLDVAGNWDGDWVSVGPFKIDLTAPGRVKQVGSTSHTPDVWSNEPNAVLQWIEANDNLSGIDGYGVLVDASAALPPETKTIEEGTGTSLSLTEGEWFVNIRSVDNATNWATNYESFGPLKIDLTEPQAVSNLQSSTHTPGVWSKLEDATLDWTGAVDLLSGLRGYSVEVAPTASLPDEVRELGATTQWNGTISEGVWYFNIRSQDRAGNWDGDHVSLGPIQIDTTDPDIVGTLSSSTHVVGEWSSLTTVDYDWTEAPDNLSGISGYSIGTTSSPLRPDKTENLGAVTSFSETLGEGEWYFNVRSHDKADNWDFDFTSFGPVRIDFTPPGKVTGLSSSTHTESVWSARPSLDLNWIAAPDNLAGIDGYNFVVDDNALSTPPETKALEEVTAHSTLLSEGVWYLKLRAVDNAQNWSAGFKTFGPIRIDLTDPTAATNLRSSSHTPGSWSPDGSVVVNWDPATDALSGLTGYSYNFMPTPSPPDEQRDFGNKVQWQEDLGDGIWYFNLRSGDVAGNWDDDFVSIGPIQIDKTQPETVQNLNSSTHTPGQWTNQSIVDLVWTEAPDNLSGIEGYGIQFDATQTRPAENLNLGAVTNYNASLAEGHWYFNIRSRDQATNWDDDFASFGPIQIDLTAPVARELTLEAGRPYTIDALIDLDLLATDARSGVAEMRFSNDGSTWSPWEAYATQRSDWDLTLFGGSGVVSSDHFVYVQFRDAATNESSVLSRKIYWAVTLESEIGSVSQGLGGSIRFGLYAGAEYGGDSYILLGSASGTTPGVDLPREGGGTVHLPLNTDSFTNDILANPNTPLYTAFAGNLFPSGRTNAPSWNPGPGTISSAWIGRTIHFAFLVRGTTPGTYRFASQELGIDILP